MQDLVVISIPIGDKPPDWSGKQQWFHAESCARHFLVGKAALLAEVPSSVMEKAVRTPALSDSPERMDSRQTMVFIGRDAYHFLLRFASGLESKNTSEYFVLKDLRARWNVYREKHWAESTARELLQIMDNIFSDTRNIRHHIYGQNLPSLSYEQSAIAMAQMKRSHQVLLIADRADATKCAARVVGRDIEQGVDSIILTHPKDYVLQALAKELADLQKQKFIGAKITPIPFSEAMAFAVTRADHVVVCTPMLDTLLPMHLQIAEAWQGRGNKSGKLVLLGAVPEGESTTHQFWRQAALENCLLPDAIRTQYNVDIIRHQKIFQRAARACHRAAHAREHELTSGAVEKIIVNHSDTPLDDVTTYIGDIRAVRQDMMHTAIVREEMGAALLHADMA